VALAEERDHGESHYFRLPDDDALNALLEAFSSCLDKVDIFE